MRMQTTAQSIGFAYVCSTPVSFSLGEKNSFNILFRYASGVQPRFRRHFFFTIDLVIEWCVDCTKKIDWTAYMNLFESLLGLEKSYPNKILLHYRSSIATAFSFDSLRPTSFILPTVINLSRFDTLKGGGKKWHVIIKSRNRHEIKVLNFLKSVHMKRPRKYTCYFSMNEAVVHTYIRTKSFFYIHAFKRKLFLPFAFKVFVCLRRFGSQIRA